MYDEDWENFREECLRFMRNKEETAIKKWLSEMKYSEPVGCERDMSKKELKIYTTHPGWLIGKAGKGVDRLKEIWSEEFSGDWKIRFIEIRGHIVDPTK